MSVLTQLAAAQNRDDEAVNVALAREIARTADTQAVRELVEGLSSRERSVQGDCIKVLYEVGEREPRLIAAYSAVFGALLRSKNNRLVWGAMTALDHIAGVAPSDVYELLPAITDAARAGSVISRDHAVGILVKLGAVEVYADRCLPLLVEHLRTSPDNQFPMYAELSVGAATPRSASTLYAVIAARLPGLQKESQKKRVTRSLKRLRDLGAEASK
jgi:hypothetical protein